MKIVGIYEIRSKIHPERCYIGSATDITYRRWSRHRKDLREQKHNPILQNHYNKYGLEDLVFTILEECPKEKLIIREQYYIDNDPLNCYFNASKTAGSCMGMKRSEETKRKISAAMKGHKGCKHTKETIEEIRRKLTGRKLTEEHRLNIGRGNSKPKPIEFKQIIKDGWILRRLLGKDNKNPCSEETRQRMRKPKSEFHKQRIRDGWALKKLKKIA